MSAPSAKSKTYAERHEAKVKAAQRKGAKRRSANMRAHSVAEVRAVLQDAIVQVRGLAVRQNRPEFFALRRVLLDLRDVLSERPTSRADMLSLLRKLEKHPLEVRWDGTDDPREYGHPSLFVHVTHDGLEQLRQAVDDRVRGGTIPPREGIAPVQPRGKPLAGSLRKLVDDAIANAGTDIDGGDPCEG